MNQEINDLSSPQDNPILSIVNELQKKLNVEQITKNENPTLVNDAYNSQVDSKKDLSSLNIAKLLEMLNAGNNNINTTNNVNNTNNTGSPNIDLSQIMNFQKAMGNMNITDPRQELLTSLKPFLRQTRQKNIDTYITILGVMKAFNFFSSNKDSD